MKALVYRTFGQKPVVESVPVPEIAPDGALIRVKATGICRSDWHGWMGHDPDIRLPHVPGHELAGVVEKVGAGVRRFRAGDRVTIPFCGGCGHCGQCATGNQQICDHYYQPGFTGWGSFAEFVAIRYADVNLVHLPADLDFVPAALLGCRFITAFRGLIDQARLQPGQWVSVFGCGGVGLSAILIAKAAGARVVAVDISEKALQLAQKLGADHLIQAASPPKVSSEILRCTAGGAHVSMDALGHTDTCLAGINALRKRGKHIQVGLMVKEHASPPIPMGAVISKELEIIGSHGMPAHRYPAMFEMIRARKLPLDQLLAQRISLDEAGDVLTEMNRFPFAGVAVIDRF
ncbi:MAG: alcohol dehydrogenase [Bacteroidetes bacterium]|nr:MAG: alcohol dehydrogenase [Bacteroidota bacterium]